MKDREERIEVLRRRVSVWPLGAMVWRLAEAFPDSPEVRHQLLCHKIGPHSPEGATSAEVEESLQPVPSLTLLANHMWLRMMAIALNIYAAHRLGVCEQGASAILDLTRVWDPRELETALAVHADEELADALETLFADLAVVHAHFNLLFVAELVREVLAEHEPPANWEVTTLDEYAAQFHAPMGVGAIVSSGGKAAYSVARRRFANFLDSRPDSESLERALQFWCGPQRRRLIAAALMPGEDSDHMLEQLLDPTYEVPGEEPWRPVPTGPDPHNERDWVSVGGILMPALTV